EWQTQNCAVAGLATFNENNIEFRRYIKEAAKAWVSKSVDALRIDTVKHMPLWFWQEFNADLQLHRPDLFIFGEWIDSSPFDERSVACANTAGMSIIDFGFCHAARAALAEGNERGFELLGEVLAEDHRYRNASELVTCIESHDMPRFQSLNASPELLHLAYVLLLTSRGVPVLLYGTEQYLHNDTAGGHDPYNRPMMERWEETEAVRIVRTLARERRRNPAVQMGGQWTLWLDADTYVFERRYRDSQCVVFLNRAAEARQIPVHGLAMRDGDYECLLSGERYSVASGSLTVAIPALAARVLSYCGANVVGQTVVKFQMNGAPTEPGDRLAIIGSCPELGEWDLQRAYFLECVNAGTWFGEVAMESSIGKNIAYKYAIFPGSGDAQTLREPRVARRRMVSEAKTLKWRDVWAS
ncbi:MAG TPA: alpha-amylase family glycosyl hydrolase, partial [Bryobacteraceae bacterium]|nr:alpha-amylase family glycosyl hydrolase [Bryobacteraceae bacterium]